MPRKAPTDARGRSDASDVSDEFFGRRTILYAIP